jgi:hypothetical protein
MVEHTFPVGQSERHTIRVRYSYWTGKAEIAVDGIPQSQLYQYVGSKTVTLDIGQQERHKVTINVHGLVVAHVEGYVDGQLVYRS